MTDKLIYLIAAIQFAVYVYIYIYVYTHARIRFGWLIPARRFVYGLSVVIAAVSLDAEHFRFAARRLDASHSLVHRVVAATLRRRTPGRENTDRKWETPRRFSMRALTTSFPAHFPFSPPFILLFFSSIFLIHAFFVPANSIKDGRALDFRRQREIVEHPRARDTHGYYRMCVAPIIRTLCLTCSFSFLFSCFSFMRYLMRETSSFSLLLLLFFNYYYFSL